MSENNTDFKELAESLQAHLNGKQNGPISVEELKQLLPEENLKSSLEAFLQKHEKHSLEKIDLAELLNLLSAELP
ncbi:hypothetical protein CSKR_202695 [Clonorchis sinensis]|uniref:Uncharacterized protein n=1 Tax=Clonorchis sinensis TaxID=79923 RepID=A0A8T1M268_CLOSI|nr:hypothetical protein CSKR_202695 [Clonorchis sinensis]